MQVDLDCAGGRTSEILRVQSNIGRQGGAERQHLYALRHIMLRQGAVTVDDIVRLLMKRVAKPKWLVSTKALFNDP